MVYCSHTVYPPFLLPRTGPPNYYTQDPNNGDARDQPWKYTDNPVQRQTKGQRTVNLCYVYEINIQYLWSHIAVFSEWICVLWYHFYPCSAGTPECWNAALVSKLSCKHVVWPQQHKDELIMFILKQRLRTILSFTVDTSVSLFLYLLLCTLIISSCRHGYLLTRAYSSSSQISQNQFCEDIF